MTKFTFKDKLKYYFENTISSGPWGVIRWLAITSIIAVLLLGLIILIFGISDNPETGEGLGFIEGSWKSMMATLDPGTMGGDEGWGFRLVRFIATLIGIFLISILIGTISSDIDQKIEELKRGKSQVVETNHILILGWSQKIFSIISELIIANENQKKPVIVILSERDKVEMEEELNSKIEHFGNTKVVVRSGNPLDSNDVNVVNFNDAKSIIVLSEEEKNADIRVIKTILGITNNKNRRNEPFHIVAELQEEKNLEAAELVGNNETIFIQTEDILSRITAQTSLQSGLSVVYSELLQFDGDEIYTETIVELTGKTYKESLTLFKDSAVIGIYSENEECLINPPMDMVYKKGDKVIAISEDDDTIVYNGKNNVQVIETLLGADTSLEQKAKKSLILGWNNNGNNIIKELDQYVTSGSLITIVSENNIAKDSLEMDLQQNLTIAFTEGDISKYETLKRIQPELFDNIIVLSYKNLDIQESDAKTLICLLHLRNISDIHQMNFNIVTEMLDLKNQELGVVARADDFIVGDNLISLLLSQLSENKELKNIYDVLFESEGSEIYLKPASRYIKTNEAVDFYTLVAHAALLNETAIGYRDYDLHLDAASKFGICINPNKEEKRIYKATDFIIVLAEN